jgi:hypothetical protein
MDLFYVGAAIGCSYLVVVLGLLIAQAAGWIK